MKKISLEQAEKIEGGCIEYGLAWAEALWAFLDEPEGPKKAWYEAKVVYYSAQWMNCTIQ